MTKRISAVSGNRHTRCGKWMHALMTILTITFLETATRLCLDGGAAARNVAAGQQPDQSVVAVGDADGLGCERTPCRDVALGRKAFHNRALKDLDGNGRSCADCHMPEGGAYQLSPAQAQARFGRLVAARATDANADDPLFRPIDADDYRVNGDTASDYSNLVELGLVRITLPLPSNVRLIDPQTAQPSNETFVDVWRAVPSLLNVRITGPDGERPYAARGPSPTGGYQWDGRHNILQDQALDAMTSHMQILRPPSPSLLDQVVAFERTIVSSDGVRALADALEAGRPLPDPDPELTPLEQQGKEVFNRACAQCHGNNGTHPSQSTPIDQVFTTTNPNAILRYQTIRSWCPRPAGFGFTQCSPQMMKNVRTYEITAADGSRQRITASDPGRGLLTGNAADFGFFDNPQLRGIARTSPYFHNNSAATLEEMLDHYDAFFRFVAANNPKAPILTTDGVHINRPPTSAERPALLAYLRRM
jgi:cytochrome c peroxidase